MLGCELPYLGRRASTVNLPIVVRVVSRMGLVRILANQRKRRSIGSRHVATLLLVLEIVAAVVVSVVQVTIVLRLT